MYRAAQCRRSANYERFGLKVMVSHCTGKDPRFNTSRSERAFNLITFQFDVSDSMATDHCSIIVRITTATSWVVSITPDALNWVKPYAVGASLTTL